MTRRGFLGWASLAGLAAVGCGREEREELARALPGETGERVAALGIGGPDDITTTAATEDGDMALATFGAGCFWGVESAFRKRDGVTGTAVGYMGGHVENPTYQQVCTDRTGHAEVVQVQYDPEVIGFDKLLDMFWSLHDPTQVNRQGPDFGSQYRTVVFYHSPEQKATAEAGKAALEASGKHARPIATVIEAADTFWRAEEYHQQYFEKKGIEPTCHVPSL